MSRRKSIHCRQPGFSTRFWLLGVPTAVALLVSPVSAQVSWQVQSGDWSVASNWGGTLPAPGGTATIDNGGTATVTQTGAACSYLNIGDYQGSGAVQMSGGVLSVQPGPAGSGLESVGAAGSGSFTLSGGTNSAAALFVGIEVGSSASYTLSGAGLLIGNSQEIGLFGGVGTFVQSGGTNNATFLTVGDDSGISNSRIITHSTGNYTLTAGLISSGFEQLGTALGVGSFTQSGGTNTCSLDFEVGDGCIGTYTLSGTGLLISSGEIERINDSGTFTQSGGTNSTPNLFLAPVNAGGGTYNLTGGLLAVSGSLNVIGGSGAAAFNFTGGTLQASGTGTVTVGLPLNGAAVIDTDGHAMSIQQLVTTSGLTDLNFNLTTPGGAAPLTIGAGGLTLNPNTAISFGIDPTTLGDYPLIDGTIGSPLLSDFTLPAAPAGDRYSLAVVGGQIELVVSAVPEPSALALLGVGAVGLFGYIRRRRQVGRSQR